MQFKPGDTYRAKTGELLKLIELTETEVSFLMLNPTTKEETNTLLKGPAENLLELAQDLGLTLIDLNTYEPTGLVSLQ